MQRYAKPEDVAHLDDAHGGKTEDMSEDESDGYLSSSSEEDDEVAGKADA